jgi:signal peptidase II
MPTPPGPAAPLSDPPPSAVPSRPGIARILGYRFLLTLAACVLVLDQASKAWISERLPYPTYGYPGHIVLIDGFCNLVNVGNTGAAWSLFSGRNTVLALLDVATLIAIYVWRRQLDLKKWILQLCFGLLCGGILGNLIDRLFHGHVIDFLDFHFGSYVYPTFNVADSGICVGIAIYAIHSLRQPDPQA